MAAYLPFFGAKRRAGPLSRGLARFVKRFSRLSCHVKWIFRRNVIRGGKTPPVSLSKTSWQTGKCLLRLAPRLKFSIWAVAVSPLAKPQSPQDFSPPAAHSNFYARRFAAQEKIARKGFLLRETRFPNAKIAPSAMYTRRFCRFSKPSKSAGFRRLETLKGGLTCRRGR